MGWQIRKDSILVMPKLSSYHTTSSHMLGQLDKQSNMKISQPHLAQTPGTTQVCSWELINLERDWGLYIFFI